MVVALLASLAATTMSGVAYLGVSRNRGPLAPWLGAEAAALEAQAARQGERKFRRPGRWLKEIHEAAADITLLLVIAHVGGVVLASVVHRENLPRAMLTGRKAAEP
jgi:cytochrome b